MSIIDRYHRLRDLVEEAALKYKRNPKQIKIIAVSKKQSLSKMKQLIELDHYYFAESYLQEALDKQHALSTSAIEWHFIGRVQSNKIAFIANNFSWVQSIDSLKHVELLAKKRFDSSPLNILIQVNLQQEPFKGGTDIAEIELVAQHIVNYGNLKLRGLMFIPKREDNFDKQREVFAKAYKVYEKLCKTYGLDTLSMGMSNDFQAAIAEGSTMIRIGTLLFGSRQQ